MLIVIRRLSMVAVLLAALVLALSSPAGAAAVPPGNVNWITIEGTCDGQPAVVLDPRGGNTAFLVGGSVLVGKIFTAIDNDTGQVLDRTVTGRGIDEGASSPVFSSSLTPRSPGWEPSIFASKSKRSRPHKAGRAEAGKPRSGRSFPRKGTAAGAGPHRSRLRR